MDIKDKTNKELQTELTELKREVSCFNVSKEIDTVKRIELAEELAIALKEIAFQNKEKTKVAAEALNANRNLEQSELKYRLIAENTSDGIIIIGKNTQVEYVSPAYLKQIGYTEEEELSKNAESIYAIIHPDERDTLFAKIFKAIEEKKSDLTYIYRVKHKNGNFIWHEDHAKFQYDSDGNHINTYVICRDITEQKKVEQDLILAKEQAEENECNYNQVVSNISGAVWKSDVDIHGNFQNSFISGVADELLELPSGTIKNSFETFFSYIKPEYIEKLNAKIAEAIRNPGIFFEVEYEVCKADGKSAWFVSKGKASVVTDKVSIYGYTIDVSKQKNTDAELVKAKEKAEESASKLLESETRLKIKLDFILSSDISLENVHLTDLIEIEQLQKIQDAFANATGVASLIANNAGEPITEPSNFSEVCKLIRQTEKGRLNCINSDKAIGLKVGKEQKPTCEKCTSCGFIDAGAPIIVAGKQIAIWMIGQSNVLNVDEKRIQDYAFEIGADANAMLLAYAKMESMSIEQFEHVLNLLWIFAQEISGLAYKNLQLAKKIEEQKEVENELIAEKETTEKSRERYRNLLENLDTGIVVHAPDTSIVSNNLMASELLGLSNDQLKGKSSIDREWKFVSEHNTPLPLEEYPVNLIVTGRKPIRNQLLGISRPWKNDIVWVIADGFPVFDSSGDISEIVISFNDITERKQAEEELKLSEERYRFSLESTGQIGWSVPPDAMVVDIPMWRQFTGQTQAEVRGLKWLDAIHPDDLERTTRIWFYANARRINYEIEYRVRRADGVYRDFLTRGIPLFIADGSCKEWVGTCIDITERKLAEQKLIIALEHAEESDRLKTAFLSNLAHEVRTPMNGILGFSALLKQPELTGEEQQQYIKIIEKSGNRMLNIINEIVEMSQIHAGLIKIDSKDTDINQKIEFIDCLFKPEAEDKGLMLSFCNSLPKKDAIIKSDPQKIFTILTNLVNNAIKYTDEGSVEFGYVLTATNSPANESMEAGHVKTGQAFPFLQFYVKDTGIGIPENRQKAIFEHFVQADIADVQARQGAGLGLSIAKAYIEMLGGKIWVESEEGKGSTFYFTIPYAIVPEEKPVPGIELAADKLGIKAKSLKILIAEDDEASQMLLEKVVETIGKEVLKADNGIAAVKICHTNADIDLILMDISMPGINGYDATRQIRQFNKEVVIIAQTAFRLSDDREKAIDAGCTDYITKPINKAELLALIHKYFRKQ